MDDLAALSHLRPPKLWPSARESDDLPFKNPEGRRISSALRPLFPLSIAIVSGHGELRAGEAVPLPNLGFRRWEI